MKYMITNFKIFEEPLKLKYKEGDIVRYYHYDNHPGIICRILNANPYSRYSYFLEVFFPPYKTFTVMEEDLKLLTPEEIKKIEIEENIKKYNL